MHNILQMLMCKEARDSKELAGTGDKRVYLLGSSKDHPFSPLFPGAYYYYHYHHQCLTVYMVSGSKS